MSRVSEAIILAAGQGKRLWASNNGTAKCLTTVGDATLIEHQIRMLRSLGIQRVIVVIGHEGDAVREIAGPDCVFVENEDYAKTNSLYSLWLARNAVTGPFVLMNCDVLAHPEILTRIIEQYGAALAFDSRSGADPEEMKVDVRDGMLHAISKQMETEQTCGENVGILRFDAVDAQELFRQAEQILSKGQIMHWAPAAVGMLGRIRPVRCVDIAGLDWIEIDFPEDLDRARNIVWPVIAKHINDANSKVSAAASVTAG
ncbi:MAG: NTP transferase domain-containing protein [Phycisphaerales bacterium]